MMRVTFAVLCAVLLSTAPASAYIFSDDFESGVSGSVWTKWSGSNQEILQTDGSHNITPAGALSARAHAADPTGYSAFADFGANSGPLRADVYVFEDFNNNGTNPAEPVTNMLALFGNGAHPNVFSDYLQLGVVPFFPGGSQTYGVRTRYNDATGGGIIDTGVSRKQGWTHLAIEADAYTDGGQVRFYIDGLLEGTSFRAGANGGAGGLSMVDLRYVRLGNNSKSYENFWYDDVRISVPEPSSVAMLAVFGGLFAGWSRRRRRDVV
jgi:hypothetical protein